MSSESLDVELRCRDCAHRELCSLTDKIRWLRGLGLLKRMKSPEASFVEELFAHRVTDFQCPKCEKHSLAIFHTEKLSDEDWGMARACENCGKPIEPERLEIIPDGTFCAACQRKLEAGELDETPDYCPRCGTPMEMRQSSRSGITRYSMVCPQCRR